VVCCYNRNSAVREALLIPLTTPSRSRKSTMLRLLKLSTRVLFQLKLPIGFHALGTGPIRRSEILLHSSHRKSTRTTVLSRNPEYIFNPTKQPSVTMMTWHLYRCKICYLSERRALRALNLLGYSIEALLQLRDSVAGCCTNERCASRIRFSWAPEQCASYAAGFVSAINIVLTDLGYDSRSCGCHCCFLKRSLARQPSA
jgi:hypothetical protein